MWMPAGGDEVVEAIQSLRARALVEDAQRALDEGFHHFNRAGVKLTSVPAILECLRDEGGVTLVKPDTK